MAGRAEGVVGWREAGASRVRHGTSEPVWREVEVSGLVVWGQGSAFEIEGSGFRVQGPGFKV